MYAFFDVVLCMSGPLGLENATLFCLFYSIKVGEF